MSEAAKNRILAVDDEPAVLEAIEDSLGNDFDVVTESDPQRALDFVRKDHEFAVVISDQRMPNLRGDEFLERVREYTDASRLLLTGYADIESVVNAVNNGKIYGYVSKPWDRKDLRYLVYRAAESFQLRREVLQEQELLHRLMDSTPDAIYFKDHQLRFIRLNHVTAQLLGIQNPKEAEGQTVEPFVDPDIYRKIVDEEQRILETGETISDRIAKIQGPNGQPLWLSITKAPIPNGYGGYSGLVGIARDVTARLRTETTLKRRESALRHAEQLARIGHRTWDAASGQVQDWSQPLTEIAGIKWNDKHASISDWLMRIHPKDRPAVSRAYSMTKSTKEVRRLSYRIVSPEDKLVYVDELLEPLCREGELRARKWFSTVQDVTAQRLKERELRLLSSATKAAAVADNYTQAIQGVLEAVCNATGWEYGEAWLPGDSESSVLRCHEAWFASTESARAYRVASREFNFRRGDGLIGKAWESGEMIWMPKISELTTEDFVRKDLAEEHGLTGVVATPITLPVENSCIGVLGFGMFNVQDQDHDLARSVGQVAAQLGACFERLETSEKLRASESYLRSVADNIPGVIYRWVVNLDGSSETVYTSSKARELWGEWPEDGLTWEFFLDHLHPDDLERVQKEVEDAVARRKPWNSSYRQLRDDGSLIWVQATAAPTELTDGSLAFDGVLLDITDRVKAEERAQFLTYYDALTGLPNRRQLTHTLQEWLQGEPHAMHVTVMQISVDQMQSIIESCGHTNTDLLVQTLAHRLQEKLHADTFISVAEGNDFILAINDLLTEEILNYLIATIHDVFGKPVIINEQELHITPSIGIAFAPNNGTTVEALLRAVAIAGDRAKQNGGDGHDFYSDDMSRHLEKRMSLHSRLRRAVEQESFELFYQPIVTATSGAIHSAEALIRWPQDDGGYVSPADFIPLAEDTGLILPIGSWVLKEAMRDAVALHKEGLLQGRLHINISARQLAKGSLPDEIADALDKTDCPPQCIELELTETGLMGHVEAALTQLQEFRDMGLTVAIDDFGTGYSSLSYLRELPVDTLKVDRSFVSKMTSDAKTAALVNSVISLAHGLGMTVVAEGVENLQELTFLQAYRCDHIQGYYFHKPMTLRDLTEELRGKSAKN